MNTAVALGDLGSDALFLGRLSHDASTRSNISPPIGNNLFVAARVANVRIEALIGGLWRFFWALCIGLLIVTFVPALSMWLPTVTGLVEPGP